MRIGHWETTYQLLMDPLHHRSTAAYGLWELSSPTSLWYATEWATVKHIPFRTTDDIFLMDDTSELGFCSYLFSPV